MAILADDLLEGVKRRISMPQSQVLLDDDDILKFADDVIKSKIVPLYESTAQEFFVTSTQITLVASTSEYDIPYRAIGRALREIKLINTSDTTDIRNLAKVAIEDIQLFINESQVSAFYFKGDRVHLVPDVPSSVSATALEVWYRLAPNKLVASDEVATVVSIDSATSITVDAVPSSFTSSTPLDFIQAKSGNRIYDIDITPTSAGSTSIAFTSGDIPDDLEVGDYIALAGYSPVVNLISDDAYPYIESCVSKRCLKAISDYEGAKELDEDIADEKKSLLMLLEPRVDGEPTIIINRTGLVRGNKFSQRRWLYGR